MCQKADLINPITAYLFGEPIIECAFLQYFELNNERQQFMHVGVFLQEILDELRKFHSACAEKYRNEEWTQKNQVYKIDNDE